MDDYLPRLQPAQYSDFSLEGGGRQSNPAHPLSRVDSVTGLAGKRVVIVEDEGVTQMQLHRVLKMAGMTVAGYAVTGEQAVEVALRETPDLILMDIQMPGRINGIEAAEAILKTIKTCVVMLTAYSEHREQAEAIGASGYVLKPVDSYSLIPQLMQAWKRFESVV
jgi:AmiR/NasT family two-component response regulator